MSEMREEPPKPPVLVNSWPQGLVEELALNDLAVGQKILEDEDICKQFDITLEQLNYFKNHIAFKAQVREAIAFLS